MEESQTATHEPKKRWIEVVTAVLMAVSSLSTAWCSYQNSRWSGQSNSLATHADHLARQAAAQHIDARQIETMHMRLWMEAMDAQIDGDAKLAKFYIDRFTDELKPAYEKWIALKPFEDSKAPPHPFAPGIYQLRYEQEIQKAHADSASAKKEANLCGNHASGFLANTVLLATVLFFAGTAGNFHQRRVRWALLSFAFILFAYAATRMLLLPVA